MKREIVEYHSRGPSGNIFCILGMARQALKKQRRITDYNTMWKRVQNSLGYQDALGIINEYVELVDLDKK